MPVAQRHTIRQVKLNLQMRQSEQVGHVQKEVNRIFKEAVLPELSALFDELVGPDRFLRVPQLKIDLGQFPTDLSPAMWRERCRAALQEALVAYLAKAAGASGDQVFASKEHRAWEAFLFFLEKGSLPWWFPNPEAESWEFEVLTMLQGKSEGKTRQLTQILATNPRQFQRFAYQFSPAFLWSVLTACFPQTKEFVAWVKQSAPGALAPQEPSWRYFLQQLFDRALHRDAAMMGNNIRLLMEHFQAGNHGTAAQEAFAPAQLLAVWEALWQGEVKETPMQEQPDVPKKVSREQAVEQPEEHVEDVGLYIDNAGLVIVAPFITPLLQGLGLVSANRFVDTEAEERAVALLRYLVDGSEQAPEYLLPFEKILCDIPTDWPLRRDVVLSEQEKIEAEKMLTAAISHWPALKQCSIAALRETFLQRKGKLQRREGGWLLQPERKTVDILLDRLPWSIGMVKLPWMQEMVWVEW